MHRKKRLAGLFLAFLVCQAILLPVLAPAQASTGSTDPFRVVAYYPSWRPLSQVSSVPYEDLTHIIYAFALPNADGSLRPLENPQAASALIQKAHAQGVKVLLGVGGWSDHDGLLEPVFASATSTAAKRTKLADTITAMCNQYGFDGVDIDWEYPRTSGTYKQYEQLIAALSQRLQTRGKLLTTAVIGGATTSGNPYSGAAAFTDQVLETVDWINVMAYDGDNGSRHSTYDYAVACGNYWRKTRGVPAEKVVLGLPFYARPGGTPYRTILQAVPGAEKKDTVVYQGKQIWYNGQDTIAAKTSYALESLGGVMIWEITQDAAGEKSLLSAIRAVIDQKAYFTDIPAGAWYAESAESARKLGLMQGTGGRRFSPAGTVTWAQAVSIAARMHTIYLTGSDTLGHGAPWYQEYADYALKNGILSVPLTAAQAARAITRAEFAGLLSKALPAKALEPINRVETIPDVSPSAPEAEAVYLLYRAGVFAGRDQKGTFAPRATLSRAECAVLIVRMLQPERRLSFTLV